MMGTMPCNRPLTKIGFAGKPTVPPAGLKAGVGRGIDIDPIAIE